MTRAPVLATIWSRPAPPSGQTTTEGTHMTKHTSGKYGRTIGQKERKAGWPAPATAWCYLCNGSHPWAAGCAASGGHPAFAEPQRVGARRTAA